MVEWSRFGMSSASPACFSNSRRDHRERPAGGCEHANAISLASTSPVTGEGTGGNSRSFRPTVAQASPPVSTNRFEIRRTVSHETPTRAAITARGSTSPAEMSSASRTRARLIIDAPRTPVVVTRTNAVGILMGVELILNAANVNFVAFHRFNPSPLLTGQVFSIFVIVLAAAEAAVALAIVLAIFMTSKTIDVTQADVLKD